MGPTRSWWPRCSGRPCPRASACRCEQLIGDLTTRRRSARTLPSVDAIVEAVARDAAPGDLVVVMSNGGFGGIHGKLLAALSA